jgi:regulator of sirC expression with transglutaminase-like and TPR domain
LIPLHSRAGLPSLAPLRSLLHKAPSSIDYGEAKLTIDKMVDASYDYDATAREIDKLLYAAQRLIATVPVPLSPYRQKVEAIRAVIYAPGWWNGFKPFMYDLANDPTGSDNPKGPLLPNYLHTRLGNCVSMPALFLAIAQRIGLDAYLSTSPEHTFVKTREPDGTYANHECTHEGGPKADESYIRQQEITPLAIKHKTYLQPLTPRQTVVTFARTLVAHYHAAGDAVAAHAVADLLLDAEPRYFEAMYCKLLAYSAMQAPYKNYRSLNDMPLDARSKVFAILSKLDEWEWKVRALGWTPCSQAVKDANLRERREALEARGKR